jgi:preprotein translocase subunit SecF
VELIPPGTKFDFMGRRRLAFLVSAGLVALALLAMVKPGIRLGVEFRGGWEMEVRFGRPVAGDALRAALRGTAGEKGFWDAEIQQLGQAGEGTFLIRGSGGADQESRMSALRAATRGLGDPVLRRFESVGARVGGDLLRRALGALALALAAILVYVAIRFPWRFSPGAVIALLHDVVITLGVMTLLGREFTLPVLAGLLTLIGFSTNDTIVVYDRIRENLRRKRRPELATLMNLSINETLSRTLITSGMVLLAALSLLVLGGPVLRDLALTLTIGVVVGTYSSIFVAGALTLEIETRWPGRKF